MASSEDQVQISKSTLGWLVGALVMCMVALAFLLGRQSVTPVVAPPSVAAVAPAPVAPPLAPPPVEVAPVAAVAVAPAPAPAPAPAVVPVAPPPPVAVAPVVVAPVAHPAPPVKPKYPPAEAAQIRKYLQQVETITAGTQDLGNPSEFANDLLNQSLLGDTSGIDSLISQARHSQNALAQIHPPAPCKEHHHLLSQQLNSSLQMLGQLKKALATSDTSGLAGLAGQGSAMQAQAQRLQRLTAELKERS